MSVRSGQSITKIFTTRNFTTGAAANGDSTPTGTLYVNGTADAASVTVTNITTGVYKAAVTLPTLAVGDVVDLRIAATVNSVSDNGVIWSDTKDVVIDSAGLVDANTVKVGPSGSGSAQTAGDILSKLLKYFQLTLRKDSAIATDNATEVTAINANGGSGGGAYANTTDSQEATRDALVSGGAGDPLATQVPGSYAAGTAGAILGTIGTGQFVVLVPLVGRTLNLVRGDSYSNSLGTAITVTKASGELWPSDLTTYTLTFGADINVDKTVGGATTPTTISGTATAVTMTGSGQSFRLEFTPSQLASIAEGNGAYNWSVTATSGSIRRTIASGTVNVILSPATTP